MSDRSPEFLEDLLREARDALRGVTAVAVDVICENAGDPDDYDAVEEATRVLGSIACSVSFPDDA